MQICQLYAIYFQMNLNDLIIKSLKIFPHSTCGLKLSSFVGMLFLFKRFSDPQFPSIMAPHGNFGLELLKCSCCPLYIDISWSHCLEKRESNTAHNLLLPVVDEESVWWSLTGTRSVASILILILLSIGNTKSGSPPGVHVKYAGEILKPLSLIELAPRVVMLWNVSRVELPNSSLYRGYACKGESAKETVERREGSIPGEENSKRWEESSCHPGTLWRLLVGPLWRGLDRQK